MIDSIKETFTQIITWIGEFVTALTATDGTLAPLLPLFAIGIGISLAMVIMKLIRKITWGT